MTIEGISFIATYSCNLACAHCFFDTRQGTAWLAPRDIEAVLGAREARYKWLHFTGGEPLLDPDRLFALVRAARKRHQGDIGIATNGFWGRDPREARRIAEGLADAGANGVGISVDPFHGGVARHAAAGAARAIAAAGMRSHSYLMACSGRGEDGEGTRAAQAISAETGIPVARVEVRRLGRACGTAEGPGAADAADASDTPLPSGPCRDLATCLGETGPFDPRMVWVDPHGSVMICYGLTIGRLAESGFGRILDDYDPARDPVLDRLSREGPKGLHALAARHGVAPARRRFQDECELCFCSRLALRPLYPATLAPAECYPGDRLAGS